MQAHSLFLQTPLLPGVGSKGRKILKVVLLHFKSMEKEHHASTYFVLTHTLDPGDGVKRSKRCFFLKVVVLHIELKGMKCRAQCKHTLPSTRGVRSKGQDFFF